MSYGSALSATRLRATKDGPRSEAPDRALVERAVEGLGEALVILDGCNRVVLANAAAKQLLGLRPGDLPDPGLAAALKPASSSEGRISSAAHHAPATPCGPTPGRQFVVNRPGGRRVSVLVSSSEVWLEGRPYVAGVIRDISLQRAVEDRTAQGESAAHIGRLVAEICHQAANLLLVVGININLLAGGRNDPETDDRIRKAEEGVAKLEAFLTELSRHYRLLPGRLQAFDAAPVLEETCASAAEECRLRRIDMTCRLAPGPAWIVGDPNGVKEVLAELVRNALEALESGGRLSVESLLGGRLKVRVRDSGPRIPAGEKERVFSPFFTSPHRRPGLGLALAKRIMDSMPGGELDCESPDSGGAVFSASWPRVAPEGPVCGGRPSPGS